MKTKNINIVIFVMNIFDALLTIFWVLSGQAVESNPFMNFFLQVSPTLFYVVKMGMVGFGLIFLEKYNNFFVAKSGTFACFFFYSWVMWIHFSYAVGA